MPEINYEAEVNAYMMELDLSTNSELTKSLISRAQQEGAHPKIAITTEADTAAPSANLTPAMLSWFQTNIATSRSAAISACESLASGIVVGMGTPGVVERVKMDELKRHRAHRQEDIYSAFRAEHGQLIRNLDQAETEHDRLRVREGGRDAKVPNHFFEWGLLLPLIMIPEGLLNFESFRRAPIIQSDFQALGVTIIVGIGIAIAAHLIGRFIRQFSFFIRSDDERSNRAGWPLWSIGFVLLVVALGVVAYARYHYLLPLAEQAIILGRSPPNIFAQTSGLLGGNIVVFLIGVGLTFMLHDSNPDFSDKARKLKKLQDQCRKLKKREVVARLAELDRSMREGADDVRRITSQMPSLKGYEYLRSNIMAIEGKDSQVAGVLSQYKQALNDAIINQRKQDFMFEKRHSDAAIDLEHVSLAKYASMNLQLLWSN